MSGEEKTAAVPVPEAGRVRPRRVTSILLGLVIFGSGVLVGAGAAVLTIHAVVTHRFQHPEDAFVKIVERIDRDLHLTPEQRKKVEDVISKKQREFFALISEGQPKMEAHLQSVRNEVAAVLDEKQAAMWKEQFDTMHSSLMPPFLPPPDHFGSPPPEPR